MTASSYGTKNEPKFADADAPDLAVNPSQAAEYAGKVGNRRTGTTAERTAATGKDVWEGLAWGDTTDGGEYKRIGSGWVQVWRPGAQPFATAAGSGSNPNGATTNVTFPVGRFTVPPIITMANTGSTVSALNSQTVTAAGAQVGGFNSSGNAIATNWMWMAVQMTPTTAAG